MSASLHRSRRRSRLPWLSLCLVTPVLAACGAEDIAGPQAPESYTSSARGAFTLNCDASNAIQLDGADDRINLDPEAIGTPASLTVETWVRIDEVGKIHILVTDAWDDFNDGFTLFVNGNDHVQFGVASSTNSKGTAVGATALQRGRWYHVAGMYDADNQTLKVFVDGVEDASAGYNVAITYAAARDLRFGMQNKGFNGNTRFLKGAIDEVRIWNRARSAAEIAADMGAEIEGGSDGLLGYWPMEEGEGSTTADMSGADNTGNLEQGPVWIERTDAMQCSGELSIDVKPGGDPDMPKPVNLNDGKIPVAILAAPEFDVTMQLDLSSLTFGRTGDEPSLHWRGAGEPNCGVDDVNDDGLADLVCHFLTALTGLQPGDGEAILKGLTTDVVAVAADVMAVTASDAVTVKRNNGAT